ncbi:hypothetical protein K933_02226 [Candidatus Halobonum tyrrellensis G22]|uniref:Uncharacterized protein n=1 Tax=Candidatus Halobonum tyrrellensis G22 TaxID=1324957 RepID=V4J2Y8_9EURY|nr:hypothetical protein K933_02226 [Candidatus Halobonum tyrrellensis G22]
MFGAPARTALDAILPEGRYTTYGYKPLPTDAYVGYEGAYYQTKHIVTGRERTERSLVRVDTVADDEVPDSALLVDNLERPSARTLKILHTYTQSEGKSSAADLLRDDAYVLRRPAELESRLGTGDLDNRVVTMTESGAWAYRVTVTTERIVEPAYTAFAAEVAGSRDVFREVVLGSRVDAELTADSLSADVRSIIEEAVSAEMYAETPPLSDAYEATLGALGLHDVEQAKNGQLLWYNEQLYRYSLYIVQPSTRGA